MHKSVSSVMGAYLIKTCLSVEITFDARKIWPNARQRNMFMSTSVAMCAHMHLCSHLHICICAHAGSDPNLCECAGAHVCLCAQQRWWKHDDSSWRQQPPYCGGWTRGQTPVFPKMNYETKPSACYSPHSWQQGPRPKTWGETEWWWHYSAK